MKKLVLSLAAVAVFGLTANAQEKEKPTFGFQQGNVMIEGSFSIQDQVSKDADSGMKEKNTLYTFNPKVGYFLTDKLVVGAALSFGKGPLEAGVLPQDLTGTKLYAGAYARYYFLELGNRFKTYAEVGLGYHEGKLSSYDYKESGVGAGIDLGFNYFLTDKFAVTFALGNVFSYKNYDIKEDGDKLGSISNTNANLNIFNNFFDNATFGLVYKF